MATRGIRGATTVERNDRDAILKGTRELLEVLVRLNGLRAEDIAYVWFTVTPDLDAEFPAVAARALGLSAVPLICAQEIDVPGALPRVIRLMVHCYASDGSSPQHVYLREAAGLRRDLEGAQ